MTEKTDPPDCLRCHLLAEIRDRYPLGVGLAEGNDILHALAAVAGDILSHANAASAEGFFQIVWQIRENSPGQIKFVRRDLN